MDTIDGTSTGSTRPPVANVVALDRRPAVGLLDGFRLAAGTDALAVPPGCQRLVAFLALRGVPVRRSLAAGTLWPDSSEERAHASLRSAIARVQRSGRGVVDAGSLDISLAKNVIVDLQAARDAAEGVLRSSPQPMAPGAPRDVIALLSGELLPGWYEDWTLLAAENWRQLRLHALECLASRLIEARQYGDAAAAALAAVGADPLRESAHVALIQVHLAEGNRSEALRAFESFRGALRAALGLEPTTRLIGLMAGLQPVAS